MKQVVLCTHNLSDIKRYSSLLMYTDLVIKPISRQFSKPDFKEDASDIVTNSKNKAKYYAKYSGVPSISDEIGVFIPALQNEPGVAVKRWAGQLIEDISDKDWIRYFRYRLKYLSGSQLECYKSRIITIALPGGTSKTITIKTGGRILKSLVNPHYTPGNPFSSFFYSYEHKKPESELTELETLEYEHKLRHKLLDGLHELDII